MTSVSGWGLYRGGGLCIIYIIYPRQGLHLHNHDILIVYSTLVISLCVCVWEVVYSTISPQNNSNSFRMNRIGSWSTIADMEYVSKWSTCAYSWLL